MKKLHIAINSKTKLTKKLEELYEVSYYEKPKFLTRLMGKSSPYPNIFFHQGSFDKHNLELLQNSTKVIVNSSGQKENILNKVDDIEHSKVQILYPYIQKTKEYDETIKENFRAKYNIEENTRLILFTAKDLNLAGIKSFIKILSGLEEKNFKAIIYSDKKQIEQLKIQINRNKISFQAILLDECENKDDLFIASDIYLLPTKQKGYTPNVLKAMHFKNAVFIPNTNNSSELVDAFSIMNGVSDPSTSFKIDALLSNPNELTQIQNINEENSKRFDFDSRLDIIKNIIDA